MSPHAKNYLLIVLFLFTLIASSVAWQKCSEVRDLNESVQTLSRQLAQARALATRPVRQSITINGGTAGPGRRNGGLGLAGGGGG